jgi:hypothetical protein
MKMPENKVPTRKQWRTLRDKAGGKKGMAKVSIGKSLDNFHAAAGKVKTPDDIAAVSKAMTALKKDLKAYFDEISKDKSNDKLAKVVKTDVIAPLETFSRSLSSEAAAGAREINAVENNIRNVTAMVIKEGDTILKELQGMNKELSGIQKKYNDSVPEEDKKVLVKFIKGAGTRADGCLKGAKALDTELNDLVARHARDHRPIIDKHNSTLGKAKKITTDAQKEAQRANANIKVVVELIKRSK